MAVLEAVWRSTDVSFDVQVHDACGEDAVPGKVGGGDLRVSVDSVSSLGRDC
jgi:hypothetical protein